MKTPSDVIRKNGTLLEHRRAMKKRPKRDRRVFRSIFTGYPLYLAHGEEPNALATRCSMYRAVTTHHHLVEMGIVPRKLHISRRHSTQRRYCVAPFYRSS